MGYREKFYYLLAFLLFVGGGFLSCDNKKLEKTERKSKAKPNHTFFQLLQTDATGVDFVNLVEDRIDFNVLTYRNYYNGGGVAIGDINNDDLPDLYFTANLTGNKLYVNKGNLVFEDITEKANAAGKRAWCTGVTMADVNGDGWLDIYLSNAGEIAGDDKENELLVNNGDLTFSEQAARFGLNNKGYSTQASFFDYDLDGDLDCYLVNNNYATPGKIELHTSMRDKADELGGDKLYRNDGEVFTDITLEANIYSSAIGYGLGAIIGDVNHDLYPDIFISNDFWERDYLYINQGDGTFSEELIERIDFCSISSMGGDIADINNDGHPEIFTTDMLAADNYRLKAMSAFDPYHMEDMKYRANYHYQIAQNCFHLNDGIGNFQEIGMLSGTAATDWSWGALFFDFENDGKKDLFISNGIQKELMYMDFRDFLAKNEIYRAVALKQELDYPSIIAQMPSIPIKNYAFSNAGDFRFFDLTDKLGFSKPSFSNGAAYGDLDNDGDMDLVINNVNMPAFIYQNEADKVGNHYLKIKFNGYDKNPFGIGAWIKITTKSGIQTLQNFNTRGFESSVEPHLLFGLGNIDLVDSMQVVWPDRRMEILTNIQADQTLTIDHSHATSILQGPTMSTPSNPQFEEISEEVIKGPSKHNENQYNDFSSEILLWRMLSTEGPRIIKGDLNNDSLEDFIVLGARHDEDKQFMQTKEGTFQRKSSVAFRTTKPYESSCGSLYDFDNDGDLDLILGAGGNEPLQNKERFMLRYFENDGRGNLSIKKSLVPQVIGNFSALEVADINNDNNPEMFLGGRCVPGNYGLPPRNFLFTFDHGIWKEITPESLAGAGMVTDAYWEDIDGDRDVDLVVIGDWMGIHIFKNENGILRNSSEIANSKGWWTRIESADLDLDGDMDFVLGNWGLNTKFKASSSRPITMFVNDYDLDGKSEFILNWHPPLDGRAYPFATRRDLSIQLPYFRNKIARHDDYARQTYESLFTPETRRVSIPYEVNYLQSAILWNDNGRFILEALPVEAQFSPAFAIAIDDLNSDGYLDIWLGGNFYALKPQVGRQDASRGVFLAGNGSKNFNVVSPLESGIDVEGEVRDVAIVKKGKDKVLVVTRNNADLVVFQSQVK